MKSILFASFIVLNWTLCGQNLIPNPGFDDLTQCPFTYGQINFAFPWVNANNGTSDIYNDCSSVPGIKVPNAGKNPLYSYQKQKSGGGYAGIGVYTNANNVYLEYIETPLKTKLVKGKNYYIEFYVSPDLSPNEAWRYTDAVGLAFSNEFYFKDTNPQGVLPLNPAVENRGILIKDTLGWTRISGCYTSKGDEKYAVIGNFRSEAETLIEIEDPNLFPYANYFYIEDVLVSLYDPFPDTIVLCNNETIELSAGFLDATYYWNTGETDSIILVQTEGRYIVEAFMDNCKLSDTVVVVKGDESIFSYIDTIICNDEALTLYAPLFGVYSWSTGSNDKAITIQTSGTYEVTVTNECGEFVFSHQVESNLCDCNIFIPNVISLNNDGINDVIQVYFNCDYQYNFIKFSLFDRWGNNIYVCNSESDINLNESFVTKSLPSGVYVWLLEYNIFRNNQINNIKKIGDITILK